MKLDNGEGCHSLYYLETSSVYGSQEHAHINEFITIFGELSLQQYDTK
jgi:hypothetical protein